ncbi:hypothetical protein SKAU_G00396550 [Synaphobranchus kaupii]|uniref:Uncharacterized protein n=1 Tax=Synaphobranchus kaupii TaxID=118154 RepID=A0A9Q1ECK9_SYNKA|nr:hypothetical protein SKAU_G00396550 [Synaphobranchus kaupii]
METVWKDPPPSPPHDCQRFCYRTGSTDPNYRCLLPGINPKKARGRGSSTSSITGTLLPVPPRPQGWVDTGSKIATVTEGRLVGGGVGEIKRSRWPGTLLSRKRR